MPAQPERHLGRNDPCWCGSGTKYKRCHYSHDREVERQETAAAEAARQEERHREHDHGEGRTCDYYRATTRSVPAVLRSEFVSLLKRMHSAGSAVLHIYAPEDLARDEERFREALRLMRKYDIQPHFVHDPQPEDLDSAQRLIDGLFATGSYRVHPSGELFRRRGVVMRPGTDGALLDFWLANPLEPRLAGVLVEAGVDDLERQGFESSRELLTVLSLAKLLRDLREQRGVVAERFRDRIDPIIADTSSYVQQMWDDDSRWLPTTAAIVVPAGLAFPGSLDAPKAIGERAGMEDVQRAQAMGVRLEEALAAQGDARRIVELAGDDILEVPEACVSWNEQLERERLSVESFDAQDEEGAEPNLDGAVVPPVEAGATIASAGSLAASRAAPRSADAAPPTPSPHPLFAALSGAGASLGRRSEIEMELAQVLDSQSERDDTRRELTSRLARLDEHDLADALRLDILEQEAAALVSSERRERHDAIVAIVGEATTTLDDVDQDWAPEHAVTPDGIDARTIAAHRQTVVDGEKMRAEGDLAKMPASLRAVVEASIKESRAFLDALPGGGDVITLPLVVGVDDKGGELAFRALVPLRADAPNQLEPGSLAASVARAVAHGLKDATDLVDAAEVRDITCVATGAASLLEVVTTAPRTAVSMVEASELAAEALREALGRSPVLTAARIAWDVLAAPTELSDEMVP